MPDFNMTDKPATAQKKLEEYMLAELDKFIEEEAVDKIIDQATEIYEAYKPALSSATLIDAEPKEGEPGFIKTAVETSFIAEYIEKTKIINISLEVPDKATELTLEAGNIGTGIGINPLILRKFGVEPAKLTNGLSKWFMKPRYHLDNFFNDIKNIKIKGNK